MARSFSSPTLFAVVGDALPRERRALGFTIQSILRRIPIALAPAAGGFAIATYGVVGGVHLGAYRANPNVELVAFADTVVANAEGFAREAGGKAYASHKEMIAAEKLDGVSICTVPATHRELAVDFLSAGVHVLCEKPIGLDAQEGETMVEACFDHGVKLMVAYRLHFEGATLDAIERVARGEIGLQQDPGVVAGHPVHLDGAVSSDQPAGSDESRSGGSVPACSGP